MPRCSNSLLIALANFLKFLLGHFLILVPPSTLCTPASTSGVLYSNQFIYSPTSLRYAAGMLNNQFGVYVAYGYNNVTSTSIWTAGQSSTPAGAFFAAQGDRNLVVYTSSGVPIWSPMVNNGGVGAPFCLTMEASGNLVWTDSTSTLIWQSSSSG
ncbi:unnamed protein product [Rotaria socialis]|uniref:Bulb-type lectin domain-containing protein n=1 Tax=Rotaria socialis TaxID=392032 RepID=A0A820WF90_9BILA|nr:unnamed protein product [Rotaria socialis]